MIRRGVFSVLVFALVLLLSGSVLADSVTFDFDVLELLDSGHYEGWAIIGEEKFSTGKFNLGDDLRFEVDFSLDNVEKIVLTIEPEGDIDDIPSGIVVLAGDVSGDGDSVSLAFPVDFSEAEGSYILATPTDGPDGNETSGLWFLDTDGPVAGLVLPELPSGWKYEGWAVHGGPLTTGKFLLSDGFDEFDGFSGPEDGPPFPGEDFLVNAPDGFEFPIDLADGVSKAVVSVEPDLDGVDPTGDGPFQIKPLVGDIPLDADDHVNYPMASNLGSIPVGSVTLGFSIGMEEIVNLLRNWGPCEDGGECEYDYNDDDVVDRLDLEILLVFWDEEGVHYGDPDVTGDGTISMEDVIEVLRNWGPCEEREECRADVSLNGVVDDTDLALVQAFWGLQDGDFEFLITGESETVGMADVVNLLASWGECPEGGECRYDLTADGDVGRFDLEILLYFWGLEFPQIGDFGVVIVQPQGTIESLTNISLELLINSSGEFSCRYSVWFASNFKSIFSNVEIENCTATTFDLQNETDYAFLLTVESDVSDGVVFDFTTSGFLVDVPEGGDGGGDDGGSGSGGSSGGGSGSTGEEEGSTCKTEWVCTDYGECVNGLENRECVKDKSYCYAGPKPEESRVCGELSLDTTEDEADTNGNEFFSFLTGAVVGEGGEIKSTGVVIFLALIVAIYAFTAAWRAGLSKPEEVKSDVKNTEASKPPHMDKRGKAGMNKAAKAGMNKKGFIWSGFDIGVWNKYFL